MLNAIQFRPHSVTPIMPGPLPKKAPVAQQKLPVTAILQGVLQDTMDGKLNWRQTRAKGEDTLETERDNVSVTLVAQRLGKQAVPETLREWEVRLEKDGFKPAILDGKALHLPGVLPNKPENDVIPNLFRAVYESAASGCDPLVPFLQTMRNKLADKNIPFQFTQLKPNIKYGLPVGAKILQVGQGAERIEVSKIGDAQRITIHTGGKVYKLTEQAFQNAEFKEALDALVQEALLQQKVKRAKKPAAIH